MDVTQSQLPDSYCFCTHAKPLTSSVVEAVMRLLTRMQTGTVEEPLLPAGLPMGDRAWAPPASRGGVARGVGWIGAAGGSMP